jgi:hypothetical protein
MATCSTAVAARVQSNRHSRQTWARFRAHAAGYFGGAFFHVWLFLPSRIAALREAEAAASQREAAKSRTS